MKTIQIVNKLISREQGISESEVERVNDFFWKENRKKLSNLESTSLSIKHLGTITVSKRMVDSFIIKTIRKIRRARETKKAGEQRKKEILEFYYEKLRKALVQRNILATQYYENYQKRKRVFKTDPLDSEESGQNMGRDNEPSEAGVQRVA